MAHEREIKEEQLFLDLALTALDHMRDEARSLRDSAAVANMRGAGDLVERDVVMGTALHRLDQLAIGDQPRSLRGLLPQCKPIGLFSIP